MSPGFKALIIFVLSIILFSVLNNGFFNAIGWWIITALLSFSLWQFYPGAKMPNELEKTYKDVYKCTSCKIELTRTEVMYSNGVCPKCGHISRSTVCAVDKTSELR